MEEQACILYFISVWKIDKWKFASRKYVLSLHWSGLGLCCCWLFFFLVGKIHLNAIVWVKEKKMCDAKMNNFHWLARDTDATLYAKRKLAISHGWGARRTSRKLTMCNKSMANFPLDNSIELFTIQRENRDFLRIRTSLRYRRRKKKLSSTLHVVCEKLWIFSRTGKISPRRAFSSLSLILFALATDSTDFIVRFLLDSC